MSLETEVKVEIDSSDLEPIRHQLIELGARRVFERGREENFLFDFPKPRLAPSGCTLRLRTYANQTLLTFKEKVQPDSLFKKREELETQVENGEIGCRILQALGLRIQFHYWKFREIYQLSSKHHTASICLDETPVGTFIEIEAPEKTIQTIAKQLGFPPECFIRKGYIEIYRERLGTWVSPAPDG